MGLKDILIRIKGDTRDFKNKVGGVEKQTNGLSNQMKKLGMAIVAAFSVRAIVGFIKKSVEAYDAQVKAEASLTTALGGREDMMRRIAQTASDLQKRTLFGDEKSIEAASRLAQNIGANEKAIKQLLPLVADFAQAKGMDMASTADLVGKTLASSTNLLSRYGIQIEGAVGSTERLESATRALEKAFGGQAEAAAKAGLGPLTQLKNIIGDYTEEIGKAIVKSEQWSKVIESATKWMELATLAAVGMKGAAEQDALRFGSQFRDEAKSAEEYINKVATAQTFFRNKLAEANAELKKTINPFKRKELKNDIEYFTVIIGELGKSVRGVYQDFDDLATIPVMGKIQELELQLKELKDLQPTIIDEGHLARVNDKIAEVSKEIEKLQALTAIRAESIELPGLQSIAVGMLEVANATQKATAEMDKWIESRNGIAEVSEEWKRFATELKWLLEDAIAGSISAFAESIGAALATGNFDNVFNNLLNTFAGFLGQMGNMMILYGIAQKEFWKSFAAGPAGAFKLIAAGVAMVAIAGGIKALANKGPAGGGSSSGGSYAKGEGQFLEGFRQLTPDLQVTVTGELTGSGSSLIGVINNETRRRGF